METVSSSEAKRLIALEKIVKRGKKTFIEVGHALAEIRDRQLYRSEYPSFEKYCQDNLGWPQKRASQIIIASEVVKQLPQLPVTVSTIVENNAQATKPLAPDLDIEQALKWWREAQPAIRGDFITRLLNSGDPVLVHNKDHFTARVMDWLAKGVQEQSKTSPAVPIVNEPGKIDAGQGAAGPATRPVLPAAAQAYRQAYKVLDEFLSDGKWRTKLEMTHALQSQIEPAFLDRFGNRYTRRQKVSDASDFAARQLAVFYCRTRTKSGKLEVSGNGSLFRKTPTRYT